MGLDHLAGAEARSNDHRATADADGVEIAALIDSAQMSNLQKRVLILCSLAIFLDGYDIQALGLAFLRLQELSARPRRYSALRRPVRLSVWDWVPSSCRRWPIGWAGGP